ncbi:hypothetical protein MYX82_04750 [Acidobacteria bacterium AH-259-D05]|nr:hypothetical protein [Acidobacteria bacterium AH-259-D05]
MGKRIRKLIYELTGKGSLFQGDKKFLDIGYDLKFFQEIIVTASGEERITGLTDFSGSVSPSDQYQLAMLVGNKLTLHLEDGRCLDVTVMSNRGKIINHGEIYKCDSSTRPIR